MRQVVNFNVTAVNFEDVICLQQQLAQCLRFIITTSSEDSEITVRFDWYTSQYQVKVKSQSQKGSFLANTPQGVSAERWVLLIFESLKNHLYCDSRFRIKETSGDAEKNFFVLYLERI